MEQITEKNPADEKYEELVRQLAQEKRRHSLELALAVEGVRSVKAATAIMDTDKLEISEDGDYKNVNAAVNDLKKSNPWLFVMESEVSTAMPQGKAGITDTSNLSDEEYYSGIFQDKD